MTEHSGKNEDDIWIIRRQASKSVKQGQEEASTTIW